MKRLKQLESALKKTTLKLDKVNQENYEESSEVPKYTNPSFFHLKQQEITIYRNIMSSLLASLFVRPEKACLTEILCMEKNANFNCIRSNHFIPSNQRILVNMWPKCPLHGYFARSVTYL